MDLLKQIGFFVELVASVFTITASGLAIYIYIVNRKKISIAINVLLNYSNQLTLSELKFKIEKLNDYTTNDHSQKKEVINILSEIEGQIIGNKKIRIELDIPCKKIHAFIDTPTSLTEPKKRSLVAELRESVRSIDVSNYNNIIK